MARPINAIISAPGTYVWALDHWVNPFNVAFSIEIGGATTSYTLSSTLDPINPEPAPGYGASTTPNPLWTPIPASQGGSGTWPVTTSLLAGTITIPVRALQLVVTALSGGTMTVNIIQPSSLW